MPRKRTSLIWTIDKEELREVVRNSITYLNVFRYLGMDCHKSYPILKKRLDEDGIDHSHIENVKVHLKRVPNPVKPVEEYLGIGKVSNSLRGRLLKEGYLEDRCHNENCSVTGKEWLNMPITLQLDHINGNKFDNRLENLRMLCPNCHSQTSTFGSKNRIEMSETLSGHRKSLYDPDQRKSVINYIEESDRKKNRECAECGGSFKVAGPSHKGKYCSVRCSDKTKIVHNRPSKDRLQNLINENTMIEVGEMFGVTDNAVKKWCKKFGIKPTTTQQYRLSQRVPTRTLRCVGCSQSFDLRESRIRIRARRGSKGPYCSVLCGKRNRNKSKLYSIILQELDI